MKRSASQTPGAPERAPRRVLLVLFVVALAVRAAIGFWASGRGEMEGLSILYTQDAMSLVAGYGSYGRSRTRPSRWTSSSSPTASRGAASA